MHMHYLNRTAVQAPACLANYTHTTQTWDDFGPACKALLRVALAELQGIPGVTTQGPGEYGLRCAYCEGAIHFDGHIEHFRRKHKNHFPELTFVWANLFLACGSLQHCGHFKDSRSTGSYDPAQLLKPDEHDPEQFLYFHSSGEVRIKAGLHALDQKIQASETIRVFGLDAPALTGERAKALSTYKKRILSDLDVIASWSKQDREDYLKGEVDATRWDPYATTIKHFLMSKV